MEFFRGGLPSGSCRCKPGFSLRGELGIAEALGVVELEVFLGGGFEFFRGEWFVGVESLRVGGFEFLRGEPPVGSEICRLREFEVCNLVLGEVGVPSDWTGRGREFELFSLALGESVVVGSWRGRGREFELFIVLGGDPTGSDPLFPEKLLVIIFLGG